MIQTAAAAYSIPGLATVAEGVASHESGFSPTAQNPGSSAAGVFQLVSATQSTMGVTNPLDATQNVDAGVALLAQYYNQYGNWTDALQAFSDGPGTVAAGLAPSSQTAGLISYVENYSGLDLSGDGSGALDLSSLGLPDLTLPDLTQDTIISGIPDWVTWLGIAALGTGAYVWATNA